MGTIGRHVRAALLVAAVAATTAVGAGGGVVPASAQAGPTITVDPSSGLADGDVTTATIAGMSGGIFGVFQYAAEALDDLETVVNGPCGFPYVVIPTGGDPQELDVRLAATFVGSNGDVVRCGVEPDDCALIAWSPSDAALRVGTTIDMEPDPLALVGTNAEAGYPVRALVTMPPGSSAGLAQCAAPAGPDLAASQCTAPAAVPLDSQGFGDAQVALVESIPGPAGAHACGEGDCVVALFGSDGSTLDSVPVTVYAPDGPIEVSLAEGAIVFPYNDFTAYVDGIRNDEFDVALCDESVVTTQDVAGGPCYAPTHLGPVSYTSRLEARLLAPPTFTGADGSSVTCVAPVDCVVAARRADGSFSSVPVRWFAPDRVTLTPSSGLLDGQEVAVDASGLEPSTDYRVLRCDRTTNWENGYVDDGLCDTRLEDAPVVASSAQGTLSTTVEATQRFEKAGGGTQLCRDNCTVVLSLFPQGWPELAHPTLFTMATGSLAASPSVGLTDGQEVSVTGTDLLPTYDGPMWWILPTGGWALGQCGAGIFSEWSVAGVFRNCVVPPGGGPVEVTGSTATRTIEAQATIQPPIGGPIDCTTGPEACVTILTRIEEDGVVTLLYAPLTFA